MTGRNELAFSQRLARRLIVASALVAAVIGVVAPVAYAVLESRALERAAEIDAREVAERLAAVATESTAPWADQIGRLESRLDRMAAHRSIGGIRVVDESRALLATYVRADAERPASWPFRDSLGVAPLLLGGHEVGHVEIRLPARGVQERSLTLFAVAALLSSGLAAFVYIGPMRLVGTSDDRMRDLVEALRRSNADLRREAAASAAAAVQKTRLHEETQGQLLGMRRLAELSHMVTAELDTTHILDFVAETTLDLLRGDLVRLWIDDGPDGKLKMAAQKGRDILPGSAHLRTELRRGRGIPGWVLEHRTRYYCPDLLSDPLVFNPERLRALGLTSLLAVPLIAGERALGIIVVMTRELRRFTPEEEELLEVLASKAATALESARLFQENLRKIEELSVLHEVSRAVTGQLDIGELAAAVHRQVERVLDGSSMIFALYDETSAQFDTTLRLVDGVSRGPEIEQHPKRGLMGCIVERRAAIRTADYLEVCRAEGVTPYAESLGFPHWLGVPMIADNRAVGAIVLRSATRPFTEADERLLTNIASITALAARSAALYRDSTDQRRRLAALVDVSQRLTRGLDQTVVLNAISEAAAQVFNAETGFRVVEGDFLVRVGTTPGGEALMRRERLQMGESISGQVALSGEPAVMADVAADARLVEDHRRQVAHLNLGALMCLPVRVGTRVLGTLNVYRERGHHFDEEALALAQSLADQAAIAIENSRLHAAALRRGEELGAVLRATKAVMSEVDLDTILERIIREAGRIANTEFVKLLLVDNDAGELHVGAAMGGEVPVGFTLPLTQSYSGRLLTGEPIFIADIQNAPENPLWEHDRELGLLTFLGLPVRAAGEVLGVLTLHTREPREYGADELECLASFADQAAVAIRNARLYEALAKRLARLRTVSRLSRLISSSLDIEEVLREITLSAVELTDAPFAGLWIPDEAAGTLAAVAFSDPQIGDRIVSKQLRLGEGAVGWAAKHRRRVEIENVFTDSRMIGLEWWRQHRLQSFAVLPVVYEDSLIALLSLSARKPFRFDDDDHDLLEGFLAQIALAIRNARLFARTETRRREAEALAEVGRVLSQTRDPDVVARQVVETIERLFDVKTAVLYRLDAESGDLVPGAVGPRAAEAGDGIVFTPGTGVIGLAVTERAPVFTPDLLTDPRVTLTPEQRQHIEAASHRAVLAMPLIVQGELIGGLGIGDREGRVFDDEEIRLAQTFADQAGLALESARLYREAGRALTELQGKNAELDSFVYSVSHDLKAPLVAVQGLAGIIAEDFGARLDDEGRHFLGRLQANIQQMERLIHDLLALSRVGRESRAPEAVSLAEVVDDFVAESGTTIRARGIKVVVHDAGVLWGVRTRIEQVMANLLGNAVKYLGDAPAPTIEVGMMDRGPFVECYVKDNGIGIEPEYHDKVFEIFQRLNEIEAEGTGVGLAIVKKIVDGAGGRLWVESAKGHGSTFRFTWPGAPGGREHGSN